VGVAAGAFFVLTGSYECASELPARAQHEHRKWFIALEPSAKTMAMKGWDKRAIRDLLGRRGSGRVCRQNGAPVGVDSFCRRRKRNAHVMVSMYQSMTKRI
jgi:hypothetical protein